MDGRIRGIAVVQAKDDETERKENTRKFGEPK